MALATVLAGIGTVRMVVLVQTARLAGAAHGVGTVLRLARGRALAAGTTIDVRFDSAVGIIETRTRAGTTLATTRLPPGVSFTTLPARGRVSFTGLGGADNATITLAGGTAARSVVVNQRGRVRLQ